METKYFACSASCHCLCTTKLMTKGILSVTAGGEEEMHTTVGQEKTQPNIDDKFI